MNPSSLFTIDHSSPRILILLALGSVLVMLSACGVGGNSSYTSVGPIPVPNTLSPPTSIVTLPSSTGVTIQWAAVSNATSYDVLRTTTPGTAYTTIAPGSVSTIVTDAAVTQGVTYYYAVRSRNAAGVSGLSPEAVATPAAGMSGITISGAMYYEDKIYDELGMNGQTVFKPVRHAELELVDVSGSMPSLTTATSATGSYTINAASYDGKTVYLRIKSAATPDVSQANEVKDLSGALYAVPGVNLTLQNNTAPTVNIAVPVSNTADGAFNILDVYSSGLSFVNSLTGAPSTALSLTAYWQPGNTLGTWYCSAFSAAECPRGAGIYVLSDRVGQRDTDEFDDDVLWHEFGHFIADKLSKDDSPGGTHYLNDNQQDLRLSWSEGWGTFFPGAVKYWLDADPQRRTIISSAPGVTLSTYIDTNIIGVQFAIDIAAPEQSGFCGSNSCKYSSNEIAAAKVLWDLMSGPANSYGMMPLWDTITTLGTATVTVAPMNLEAFWDQFKHLRGPSFASEQAGVENCYAERLINYREDPADLAGGDDSYGTAVLISVPSSTVRYLFKNDGSADVDYFRIVGTGSIRYTISTMEQDTLKNGADTMITVLGTDGKTQVTAVSTNPNDNYNNVSYAACDIFGNNCPVNGDVYDAAGNWSASAPLSSKVTFDAPSAGTYYIRVETTPNPARPQSAGRYGTYTLKITSP